MRLDSDSNLLLWDSAWDCHVIPHTCPCGESVDNCCIDGLSWRWPVGSSARHFIQQWHNLLDFEIGSTLAIKGPEYCTHAWSGKLRGLREVERCLILKSLTLVPWNSGKCPAWYAKVRWYLGLSYIALSIKPPCWSDWTRMRDGETINTSESHHFITSCCRNAEFNWWGWCQFYLCRMVRKCDFSIKERKSSKIMEKIKFRFFSAILIQNYDSYFFENDTKTESDSNSINYLFIAPDTENKKVHVNK